MYRITGSVGQGGRNAYDDVLLVQKMLNKNMHLLSGVTPVQESGAADQATLDAIAAFQRQIMHSTSPDGRVDPNGRTWRVLTGEQPHGSSNALVQLAEQGDNYYIYTTRDKQFGTQATINSITTLAANLKAHGLVIAVGDISFRNGALMKPHKSHRRGNDVDIRPQRTDRARVPVTIHDKAYDRDSTKKVVEVVQADTNLQMILFNDTVIPGVASADGHHNHLHLRFKE
jgi:hypothetical protein